MLVGRRLIERGRMVAQKGELTCAGGLRWCSIQFMGRRPNARQATRLAPVMENRLWRLRSLHGRKERKQNAMAVT